MSGFSVPLFLRGQVIEDDLVPFGLRTRGGFSAPDPHRYLDRIPLRSPGDLADLYTLTFDDLVELMERLGDALDFDTNAHLQQAFEASVAANPLPESMLRVSYQVLAPIFARDAVVELAETSVGIDHLEGWVHRRMHDGRDLRVRAFGARTLHIPAGNGGIVSALTILRSVITRSDAIIKAPSNDPLTAMAIARTLADIAPDHPVTRHLVVAYWKGGDEVVESALYRPEHIEKIVAWGGLASVRHVSKYVQPGLELIALDPKRSATIIGPEAFADEATLDEVAARAAVDVGVANQEACANARVIYVMSGTDPEGLERANRLGERIYQKMVGLPPYVSTPPTYVNRELKDHLDATRLEDDWYRVYGGEQNEGAVIVSQLDEPVDYSALLSCRVANVVPVDGIEKVTAAVNAYTQTIGIYPESLKAALRDTLPLFGAQRLTSLGYACNVTVAMPQDAIEPIRRMCRWIVDEECDPARVTPLWELAVPLAAAPH